PVVTAAIARSVDIALSPEACTQTVGPAQSLAFVSLPGLVVEVVDQPFGAAGVPAFQGGAGVDIGESDHRCGRLRTERLAVAAMQPEQVPASLPLGVLAVTGTVAHLLRREVGDDRQSFHGRDLLVKGLPGSRSPRGGLSRGQAQETGDRRPGSQAAI